jgi:hypothetical protein
MEDPSEEEQVRLGLDGKVLHRLRRTSQPEQPDIPEHDVPGVIVKVCPKCGSDSSRRIRRAFGDKLLFRSAIRRCLQCDERYWTTNAEQARTAALAAIAAAFVFIVGFSVWRFAPAPVAKVPPPYFGIAAGPRTNRLRLTPQQTQALLRRIQGAKQNPEPKSEPAKKAAIKPPSPPPAVNR